MTARPTGPGPRLLRLAGLAVVGALVLTGCRMPGLQDFTLPGGTASGDTINATVYFDDVLDLVPQASVRVGDVPVGDVTDVTLDGFRAKVKIRVNRGVDLPANTVATLEQSSLLGEKYVALSAPPDQKAQGRLQSGAVIQASRSSRLPEIEEVFSALSMVLNGGGVEQLQVISTELSDALEGREGAAKDVLHQLSTLVGGLDQRKSEIVRLIDRLDDLSTTLVKQRQTIGQSIDDITPGLKVFADQEHNLTLLLQSLGRLGQVSTRVINASKDNTVADLKSLEPILTKLAQSGTYLPGALELLITYPFPRTSTNGIFSDQTGLRITLDTKNSLIALCQLGQLPDTICSTLPGLPTLSDLPLGGGSGSSGSSGGGGTLPGLPGVPNAPTLPTLPGAGTSSTDPGITGLLMGGLS